MLRARTDNPDKLLAQIRRAIDNGEVQTWSYDDEGDFLYLPSQWAGRGWFRPRVTQASLMFNILAPRGRNMTRVDYGVYHGRLAEMLLAHFDDAFTTVESTALPSSGDAV